MSQDNNTVLLDYCPEVNRNDAITFMVHHIMLAAAFFETIPDDISGALDEIAAWENYKDDPKTQAAIVWLKDINQRYEDMKKDDVLGS